MEEDQTLHDTIFRRKLRYSTYSPVISLSVLIATLVTLVVILLATMQWVDHSNRVIERAVYTEKLLLDLQTATRGFYLTGDASFLAPYSESRSEVPESIADLHELVDDNPAQALRANKFEQEVMAWHQGVASSLTDARTGKRPTVGELRDGEKRFAEVRDAIAQFLNTERELRDRRSQRVVRVTRWSLGVAGFATVIVALVQCTGMRRRLRAIKDTYREALRLAKERRGRVQTLLVELDRELQAVGEIQRSLLPITLPAIPGLDLAASYQTSRRAGGDYYDFFRLPPRFPGDDRLRYGILIADVSGHGTPAAVLMAVTHSIAHGFDKPGTPPDELVAFVNQRLCDGYTTTHTAFVTAFYAIYDSATRELSYSSAGHNPPRLRRAGQKAFEALDDAQGLPLGIMRDEVYPSASRILHPGDTLVLYTDGITEARNDAGDMLGVEGLDAAIAGAPNDPDGMLQFALQTVNAFTGDTVDDDRTLLVARTCDVSDDEPSGDVSRQAVLAPQSSDLAGTIR